MSDSLPSCFRGGNADHPQAASSVNANLTTCLYNTHLGIVALTWCRNIIGHSLHIQLHFDDTIPIPIPSFRLHLKPWIFWKKQGSKLLHVNDTQKRVELYWDLTHAKFLSGPEPDSGFYVAVVVAGEMTLLVGDSTEIAYAKTRAKPCKNPVLVLRREHVFVSKCYTTKARFGGEFHDISIDCRSSAAGEEPKLSFIIDRRRVLQVKRLRWKFRGNEKIEVEGVPVQISWDVYNWLFDDAIDGHAVFMFRFDKKGFEDYKDEDFQHKGLVLWQPCGVGLKGFEMKKSLLKTSSSSSSSSASSSCSSSVMEWASSEDNEFHNSAGFSLLVYAWKR